MSAEHVAAHILGVTQTPEGHRLQVRSSCVPRNLKCSVVLPQTPIEITARKTQISAQHVNTGQLGVKIQLSGSSFGSLQISESPIKVVCNSPYGRQPHPRQTAFPVISCHL
jgi:hypothetical protein